MLLQTPLETPDHKAVYGITINPNPTISDVPKKHWLIRCFCKHRWILLYKEELMFFQEHVGDALHHVCSQCGETKILETD